MMLDKSKIAIVTTCSSFELYDKTAVLFPKGVDKFIIDGRNGMYGLASINYMFSKFKKTDYEWIIMVDEDVFFEKPELVFEIIEEMKANRYSICGVRDGGVIKHRFHNPLMINTFFSIINFKKLNEEFDYKEILQCQKFFPELYIDRDLKNLKYAYDIKSLKEPYYCFYNWALKKDFRFLYVETDNPLGNDDIGNMVLSPFGNKLAFHSWYARTYNVYEDQTTRINNYLKKYTITDAKFDWTEVVIYKKPFYKWFKRLKKSLKLF